MRPLRSLWPNGLGVWLGEFICMVILAALLLAAYIIL